MVLLFTQWPVVCQRHVALLVWWCEQEEMFESGKDDDNDPNGAFLL